MYVLTAPAGVATLRAGVPRHMERYAIARAGNVGLSGGIHYRRTRRGGLAATPQQIIGTAGTLAQPVVMAAAAPAVAAALGITASLAVPIVGAAFAGVLFGVNALLNSGCGQTCVVTSQWANEAEPLLQQNIAKYFSIARRTESDRRSALNIFDAVWAGLVERCSQPGLSTAGRNCVEDRKAGACKWRQTADSPLLVYPGEPKPGECWNWFSGYRDPIANDRNVVSGGEVVVSSLRSLGGGELWPLAAIAGLVALGVLL